MTLSKKLPQQWRKSLSSKYPFLTLLLNKKNKNENIEYIAPPCHSKFRSTQNVGAPLFSCLGYGAFGKGKVFSEDCNLSNLVDIQR